MKNLKVFWMGLSISFLGSLPLGTMNVTVTHIAVRDGVPAGFSYSVGSMLVEIICVYIVLQAMNWVDRQRRFFRLFEWVTLLLLGGLAFSSFIAAIHMRGFDAALPASIKYPFLLGALLSATNPLHVVFWLGWSTFLLKKNILLPQKASHHAYVTGIGLGTLLGFSVFIFGGSYFTGQLKANQDIINWSIGIILTVTALIQLYKMTILPARSKLRNT
ncbi:MAG TPA: LysE family transporter [Chitinophagaceae bacterium]|nr:LysE family transporter [Chitinophagaceae bacterium]